MTRDQSAFTDYVRLFWSQLPRDLGFQDKLDQLNTMLDSIANNPRYLAYLRAKVIQKLSGIWSITNAHVQQAQLEKVYSTIQNMNDFVNEPRVMEMRKVLSELYNVKKHVSTGKRFSEVVVNFRSDYEPVRYKGVSIPIVARVDISIADFHSLYVTFPGFSYAKNRHATQQVSIVFQLVCAYMVNGKEENIAVDLYRINKVNEANGVALRPKAYIYWVRSFAKLLFESFSNYTEGTPNMAAPYLPEVFTKGPFLRVSLSGYNLDTYCVIRVYSFEPASFVEYPFLSAPMLVQKYVQLLDLISKQNYKMDKYRQKVAKRQKYTLANQNSKMLNAVYGRFGDPHNSRNK